MRRSVYKRYLEGPFGKLKLDEISPAQLMKHFESIREKGAAAPAVQMREIVLLVYRFAVSKDKSLSVVNPAEATRPSDIATFKARDRALNPTEIRRFLAALDTTATAATLRLALRFVMLTMIRKGEFINATWGEVDFDSATWTFPKERMKTGKPHVVYVTVSQTKGPMKASLKTCHVQTPWLSHVGTIGIKESWRVRGRHPQHGQTAQWQARHTGERTVDGQRHQAIEAQARRY